MGAWRIGQGAAGTPGTPVITALTPAAVSNTVIAAAVAASAANAITIAAQPDVPRNMTVTTSGAGYDGGDLTGVGTDVFDAAQTETITPNAGAGATVAGTKVFKTLTSITKATVGVSAVTVSCGTGSIIGGPIDREELFLVSCANGEWTFLIELLSRYTTARRFGVQKTDSGFNALIIDANGAETIGAGAATTATLAGQGELLWLRKASSTNWAIDGLIPGLPA